MYLNKSPYSIDSGMRVDRLVIEKEKSEAGTSTISIQSKRRTMIRKLPVITVSEKNRGESLLQNQNIRLLIPSETVCGGGE